jgi:hypothetical protein
MDSSVIPISAMNLNPKKYLAFPLLLMVWAARLSPRLMAASATN